MPKRTVLPRGHRGQMLRWSGRRRREPCGQPCAPPYAYLKPLAHRLEGCLVKGRGLG